MTPTTPLQYLRQEIKFNIAEWNSLTEQDKADLRRYAEEEMKAIGIPVKAAAA